MLDAPSLVPWLFERPGTLLYIGYRPPACPWLDELAEAGNEVTVLELEPRNVTLHLGDPRVTNFMVGDVRRRQFGVFDHIWWWHGPERVLESEFPGLVCALCMKARSSVVVCSPIGMQAHPQGFWYVLPDDYRAVGLETAHDEDEVMGWAYCV